MFRPFVSVILAGLVTAGCANQKTRIDKAADLPRFTYAVTGPLEELVRDGDTFRLFAADVYRDHQSVLDRFEIADKSAHRDILGLLAQIDFLEGRYAEAAARAEDIRALEEKPADKLLSGLPMRAMVAAQAKIGDTSSEDYRREVARLVAAELAGQPYAVIANGVTMQKSWAEIIGETLLLGGVRDQLQPAVDKAGGTLSSDLAPQIVQARFGLLVMLPLKQTLIDTYVTYLAANVVEKPDIWAARDVQLPVEGTFTPVAIAVWDSGVDVSLFDDRVVNDNAGMPALLAFDAYGHPSSSGLMPIPVALRDGIPRMKSRIKGLSDLTSNVDSPESSAVKVELSRLEPEQFKGVVEELGLVSVYAHGTHVAGIAMAGNPHARLVNARLGFSYTLLPDPCPTRELVDRRVANVTAFVEFFRKHNVRVVNVSWGESIKSIEGELELCSVGATLDDRARIARQFFELQKKALHDAFVSAPEILFVTAADNSNGDAAFEEDMIASLVLPNLLTVGAVDVAGDETQFTSYGPTVKAHANGYLVDSYLPGGDRVALSGTSMASPQVAGLAAKMLAVNPALTPHQVIAIILQTVDTTEDGRRFLVHPAKAVAAARRDAK